MSSSQEPDTATLPTAEQLQPLEKHQTRPAGGQDESGHKMHPVLRRLEKLGKFRLLWEYYKVYIEKKPECPR